MRASPPTSPIELTRPSHDNGLGFLRLVFALLVIVSHTPEMIDGDRRRELLTMMFGSISFGELAVDCFFVISGYLIVASYQKDDRARSGASYLRRRVARIYPGFVVASLLSLLIVAPLAGANTARLAANLPWHLLGIAFLQVIEMPDVFVGMPYPSVNGAVWTIAYEFACYLLVMLLGVTGMLRRPAAVAGLAAIMLFAWVAIRPVWPDELWRLTGLFLIGTLFHLYRDHIRYTRQGCVIAAAGLLIGLATAPVAEIAVAIFGGYLIFAFAGRSGGTVFARINNRDDISYGVYLCGWPIGSLLVWYAPDLSPPTVAGLTMIAACACGWVSWRYVERPALRWLSRRAARRDGPPSAMEIA